MGNFPAKFDLNRFSGLGATVVNGRTDGQTDRQTDGRTRDRLWSSSQRIPVGTTGYTKHLNQMMSLSTQVNNALHDFKCQYRIDRNPFIDLFYNYTFDS